jgi:hypothetical protein
LVSNLGYFSSYLCKSQNRPTAKNGPKSAYGENGPKSAYGENGPKSAYGENGPKSAYGENGTKSAPRRKRDIFKTGRCFFKNPGRPVILSYNPS